MIAAVVHAEHESRANAFLDSETSSANASHLKPSHALEKLDQLPQEFDYELEKANAGDLFLSDELYKTSEPIRFLQQEPAVWIPVKSHLCAERIIFTAGVANRRRTQDVIVEDVPLVLLTGIAMGVIVDTEKVHCKLSSIQTVKLRDNWWQKVFEFLQPSQQEIQATDFEEFIFEPIEKAPKLQSEGRRSFLRLKIECKDTVDPGWWHYVGQTEWLLDDDNPRFATPLDIPYPSENKRFRFTVVDIDDANNVPTKFDPHAAKADLLGIAELDASQILDAIGKEIRINLSSHPDVQPSQRSKHAKGQQQTPTILVTVESVREVERPCILLITDSSGCYVGRRHALLFESERTRNQWVQNIRLTIQRAKYKETMRNGWFFSMQMPVKTFYENPRTQLLSGSFVMANFITDAYGAEVGPSADIDALFFTNCFFTAIFTVELAINMYANWFRSFFLNGWNLFDMFTVMVSFVAILSSVDISTVRLFRAFRVMRLVKRITSLRLILNAVAACILPLSGALFIMFLVIAAYDIIATTSWGRQDRGLERFSTTLFTLFQVSTGDKRTNVTFTLLYEEGASPVGLCIFMASFVVSSAWIVFNIVIAVMLREFSEAVAAEKLIINATNEEMRRGQAVDDSVNWHLEPVLAHLADFSSQQDLTAQIGRIWARMDRNGDGLVHFVEFCSEMRRYNITFTLREWQKMLETASDQGIINPESVASTPIKDFTMTHTQFDLILIYYLKEYYQLGLVTAAQNCSEADLATLFTVNSLKMALLNQTENADGLSHRNKPLPVPVSSSLANVASSLPQSCQLRAGDTSKAIHVITRQGHNGENGSLIGPPSQNGDGAAQEHQWCLGSRDGDGDDDEKARMELEATLLECELLEQEAAERWGDVSLEQQQEEVRRLEAEVAIMRQRLAEQDRRMQAKADMQDAF